MSTQSRMTVLVDDETVDVGSPKSVMSPVQHLTEILTSDEELEPDSREVEKEKTGRSDGLNPERQAPSDDIVSVDNVPEESAVKSHWVFCMQDLFTLDGAKDSWCGTTSKTAGTDSSTPPDTTKEFSASPDIEASSATNIKLDEHNSTGFLDDGESIGSVSTLGKKVFGDLRSLPSVTDSKFLARNVEADDGSTIASMDAASVISIPMHGAVKALNSDADDDSLVLDSSSITSGETFNTETLESAIEEKLRNVDVGKTIGDTEKSAKELIKSSSSASARSMRRKKKAHRVDRDGDASVASKKSSLSNTKAALTKSRRSALVRELRKTIEDKGRYAMECANIAASLGDIYEEEKDYNQALKLHKEATTIYTTKLGDHHATTIDSKVRLGKLMEKMGEYDRAIDVYFNVLIMRKAMLDGADSSIPDTLSYISSALKRKGKTTQAIKELKRALKLYRSSLGDSHPRVTSTVDEISSLYIINGDYTKATAILEEVVKLKAATGGINNADVAKTLLELATAYKSNGEHAKALRSLKKCYSIEAAVYGENSDHATKTLERIALNYKRNGDTERAVAAYLGVLRGRKERVGEAHPVVADTYLQLGIVLRANKQPEKSMKCMKQALSIYVGEGKNMNDVGMIAEVMHEMALIHRSKGQLSDAIKILKQELTIRQKMGERELHQVAVTLHHLGTTELEMKNSTKALNFFMEALTIYEKTEEEVGIDFAKTLYCTGIVFDATRHQDRAKEAYKESIKVMETQGLSEKEVERIVANLDTLKLPTPPPKRALRVMKLGQRAAL